MNPAGKRQKILIIDDMVDFSKMLMRHLDHWGYQAFMAATGEQGFEIAQAQRPDLILLDILLPQMKGRELCARLKKNPKTRGIPVIFISALGMSDHVKAGLDLGAEDYIIKPFRPTDLKERIRVCLLRSQKD